MGRHKKVVTVTMNKPPKPPGKHTSYRQQRSVTGLDTLIGQKVRARRMELKISQQELGEKLGVSFQQIQKYEKGVNRVGAARLQQISAALDVPMIYFIDNGSNGKEVPSKMSAFMATREGTEIAEVMMKLSEPHARAIISLARTLANAYP